MPDSAISSRDARARAAASQSWDAVVVGAGFGGLGCAMRLAERGLRPLVLEALNYPGGCASTYERKGYRFESGATLFSGFDEGQLFRRWIDRHGIDVELERLDPVVELRTPNFSFEVPADRQRFLERWCALEGAPVDRLRRFFRYQERVADALWSVLDDPRLLPPFGAREFVRHAGRALRYLPLVRFLGRPLLSCLRAHGLADFAPLRQYLDGLCQITVQCGIEEAETAFALSTMDYYFRGARHVRGGIGVLASGLVEAVRGSGGEVLYATRARSAEREANGSWSVETRRGTFRAPRLALNLLPENAAQLLGEDSAKEDPTTAPLQEKVASGWGACMLYLVAREPEGFGEHAHHVEIVQDPEQPYVEGNHLFCSISSARDEGRCPPGTRTITVSTHVPMERLLGHAGESRAAYVGRIQRSMREGLERHLPEWLADVRHEETASPRTFERFTGRAAGYVGGIPRRAGLRQYLGYGTPTPRPGVALVGDSVFPGQSTLATALGGWKAAEVLARHEP